ncbi:MULTISPECIES: TetR/AcrR family transcriptional regulator [unclassified Frankia]|uniref:SbtR family transcriptional regulator n=1 Tax=unclassified Frankia TaxID=2632575 RepID=UPI002AD4CB02|nr:MULTISPECIES: TetR/AcrR family transcriptional regulator [unclassified Frankia]
MPDAWDGFAFYLERLCSLQAHDRGFNDVASMHLPKANRLEEARSSAYDLSCRIIARAQQQGTLRDDVTAEDIAILIWANTRIIQATRSVAPRAWQRHLGLMLDAFRAERASSLPEPPMCPAEVCQAMLTLGDSGFPGG